MVEPTQDQLEPNFTISDHGGIPPPIRFVTHDDETLDHLVSEGQLKQIEMGKRDVIAETFLLTSAGLIGAVIPAIGSLIDFYNKEQSTFNTLDLWQVIVFFVLLGATIVSGIFWLRKSKISKDVFNEIRGRTTSRLGNGNAKNTIQSLDVE